jgi:hypothetical protein
MRKLVLAPLLREEKTSNSTLLNDWLNLDESHAARLQRSW